MRLAILTATALLAGCATYTPQQLTAAARGSNDLQLCEALYNLPSDQGAYFYAEIRRRQVNCSQFEGVFAARDRKRQQEAAALQNAANYFNRPMQPMPAPAFRPPVNCTSYRLGNTVETSCQ